MNTTLTNKIILVTGANRGIGQALVAEALGRGAGASMPGPASSWPTPTSGLSLSSSTSPTGRRSKRPPR